MSGVQSFARRTLWSAVVANGTALLQRVFMYSEYLKTKHWQEKRARIKGLRGNFCFLCAGFKNIHIHHIQYTDRLGLVFKRERDHQLIPLCAVCHSRFHAMYGTMKRDLQYFKRVRNLFTRFGNLEDAFRYGFSRETTKIYEHSFLN